MSVWDIETGYKSLTFSNAHAQEEITCLSFDLTNKRLFTGARDGSIKVSCENREKSFHTLFIITVFNFVIKVENGFCIKKSKN